MGGIGRHDIEEVDDGRVSTLFGDILPNGLVDKGEKGCKVCRGSCFFLLLFKGCFDGLQNNSGLRICEKVDISRPEMT